MDVVVCPFVLATHSRSRVCVGGRPLVCGSSSFVVCLCVCLGGACLRLIFACVCVRVRVCVCVCVRAHVCWGRGSSSFARTRACIGGCPCMQPVNPNANV